MRYVPMPSALVGEIRKFVAANDNTHVVAINAGDRLFPPNAGAESGRQRVEGSFDDLLERAKIENLRFHNLRHTFASDFFEVGRVSREMSWEPIVLRCAVAFARYAVRSTERPLGGYRASSRHWCHADPAVGDRRTPY